MDVLIIMVECQFTLLIINLKIMLQSHIFISSFRSQPETTNYNMPTADISVTLHEALEYRGSPLLETEIWSVLHQTLVYLQNKISKLFFIQISECLHIFLTPTISH